jgi:preprotein translocase subunit SecE
VAVSKTAGWGFDSLLACQIISKYMNNVLDKKDKLKNGVFWLLIVLITASAFFCTYYFNISGPIRAIVWIVWLVLVLLLAYFTTQGKQAFLFAKEAKIELLKVVWPTRQETVQTTTIVMVMVTLTGFVLWGVDSIMMWAIAKITHLG